MIGTSGLTATDFEEIDAAARAAGVGRDLRRQLLGHRRDGQGGGDAGVALHPELGGHRLRERRQGRRAERHRRELAETLGEAAARARTLEDTHGAVEARGADIAGTQVHSVRLPSFTVSTEIVFAAPDERLSIRHDAGSSAAPYVAGTLLAIRAVPGRTGLTRGLDALLLAD